MKIRIALFIGLTLTLGTAAATVAVHSAPSAKAPYAVAMVSQQQNASADKATSQNAPAASRILVLPRPL